SPSSAAWPDGAAMGFRRNRAISIDRSRPRAERVRRATALLGVVAILFQALLAGWHYHKVLPAGYGPPSIANLAKAEPLAPATAENNCQICTALHHLSTAPGEFIGNATPIAAVSVVYLSDTVLATRFYRLATARGPPSFEISA